MTAPAPALSLRSDLVTRIASHWWLKFFGISAFITVFFVGYFLLLRFPVFPVTIMPLTALDRLIPFEPGALWLYLSLWCYVSLPPTLLRTRPELFAYGWLAGAVAVVGLAIFFFWPTAIPAATDIDWTRYPAFARLKTVDAAQNACPSLHVAFAVFSGVWLDRILRVMPARGFSRLVSAAWCAGIVYSTVATRQHVAIDALAGTALGWAGAWFCPAVLKPATLSDGVG
jgi:hypothetical protein